MHTRRAALLSTCAALLFAGSRTARSQTYPVSRTDAEWKARLTNDQYLVLRQSYTERAWTSTLLDEHRPGRFACVGCDQAVFASETKYDSQTGWPSFYAPIPDSVATKTDLSEDMERIEVHCSQCGGHLGHVFSDGPPPTGLRYCINGLVLVFKPVSGAAG